MDLKYSPLAFIEAAVDHLNILRVNEPVLLQEMVWQAEPMSSTGVATRSKTSLDSIISLQSRASNALTNSLSRFTITLNV